MGILSFSAFGQSLQQLIDNAAKSDNKVLKLDAKTYFISEPLLLTSVHSGLTIEGRNGTVISGAKRVSGWTKDGRLWKAKLENVDYVSSLFVNGKRANFAKTPNDGFVYFYRDASCDRNTQFLFWKEDISEILSLSKRELKNLEIRSFFQWIDGKSQIAKIEDTDKKGIKKITFSSPVSPHYCSNGKQSRCWFDNFKGALDQAGEYYYDSSNGEIWYMPREGENMKNAEVYVPNCDTLLSIKGKSEKDFAKNINLKNLSFKYASQKPNGKDGTWRNSGQGASNASCAVVVEHASNVNFISCAFENLDGYAVEFYKNVSSSSVKNCVMGKLGAGGVRIGNAKRDRKTFVDNIEISNNIIYQYGRVNRAAIGVIAYDVSNISIINNDIFDGYYSGVSTGWTWGYAPTLTKNNKVNYNHIHHLGYGQMCDMGGVYTLGVQPNSETKGNLIHDINCHEYGGWGLYNDEGSSFIESSMNCIYATQSGGYNMHFGQNCKVFNNLIFDCKGYQLTLGGRAENSYTFERNIICYTSPQVIFRHIPLNALKFGKYASNVYWNTNGEVKFGNLTFEQWKEKSNDVNSIVAKVNPQALMKGEGFPQIKFKPLDISRAGVGGSMKQTLREILKDYKYPEVKNYLLHSGRYLPLKDDFRYDKLGKTPSNPKVIGSSVKVIEDSSTSSGRAILVKKVSPKNNMLYFFYKYTPDFKKPKGFAKFMVKLTPKSHFTIEFRNPNHQRAGNSITINKLKVLGETLPANEWLNFEFTFDQPLTKSDKGYMLKVTNSKGKTILEKEVARNVKTLDVFTDLYFIFGREEGIETTFADISASSF